jgi:beta-glucosidase-like glycosyl hydrolase
VDRLGPLLGVPFASAAACSEAGTDRVHENAYLMGRAARLLGFDVDFAPCLDLGQPGAGAVVLEGRCFGFHAEDVVIGGMVFLHGLARAGLATCVKHFPGLGRGAVDSHAKLPVVDAHDVDLMVTDVAPFTKLARGADGVMVGHAAYPGFEDGAIVPASCSPKIHSILRGAVRFDGVVYSDDLEMSALEGTLPERAERAAAAGCDVVILSKTFEAYEEAVARVDALGPDAARAGASPPSAAAWRAPRARGSQKMPGRSSRTKRPRSRSSCRSPGRREKTPSRSRTGRRRPRRRRSGASGAAPPPPAPAPAAAPSGRPPSIFMSRALISVA